MLGGIYPKKSSGLHGGFLFIFISDFCWNQKPDFIIINPA